MSNVDVASIRQAPELFGSGSILKHRNIKRFKLKSISGSGRSVRAQIEALEARAQICSGSVLNIERLLIFRVDF